MLIAAVRTGLAGLVVSLYVVLVGPPVLIWSLLTRRPRLLYAAAAFGVRIGFWLTGIRLDVRHTAPLRPGRAVYVCNHTSNVESPAVFLALSPLFPRVRVLYKAELRKLPILVWAFDVAGFVPVERRNREQSWPAIDRAAEALGDGNVFFAFPEGTRSATGELLPFKKGPFVMAIKGQAPIVPVAIVGARAAMRKGTPVIFPATVRLTFLPAVETAGLTVDDRDQLIARVREVLTRELARV
jgi:1-acyl-sn-glycerol-3-phosphate acyltransferase